MRYLSLLLLISTPALSYEGSSFKSVWDVVEDAPYDQLENKKVTLGSFFKAGVTNLLEQSAKRTVATEDDVIPYFTKLLHPNGICLRGDWLIDTESAYSGYFKNGSSGKIIARASTTISNTRRGSFRGFGLAGKVFPTMDENEAVKTANFFQIDNLIGTYAKHYSDVRMTNEPAVVPPISLGVVSLARIGAAVAKALPKADENPGLRQMYPISMLGARDGVTTPTYMATQVSDLEIKSEQFDFREELQEHISLNGQITFNILVSEDKKDWTRIGSIVFYEALASSGCDHRLHFHHHKLKK